MEKYLEEVIQEAIELAESADHTEIDEAKKVSVGLLKISKLPLGGNLEMHYKVILKRSNTQSDWTYEDHDRAIPTYPPSLLGKVTPKIEVIE